VGTREVEKTYQSGKVLKQLGGYIVPESKFDGNHVMVDGAERPWLKQLKLLGGYAAFYNPLNLLRAFKNDGTTLRRRRIGWQLLGQIALLRTAWKVLPYLLRLLRPITYHTEPPALATVPVRLPEKAFSRLPEGTPLLQIGWRNQESRVA
jgi:hypothetical protein